MYTQILLRQALSVPGIGSGSAMSLKTNKKVGTEAKGMKECENDEPIINHLSQYTQE